jgi:hypothetical protein
LANTPPPKTAPPNNSFQPFSPTDDDAEDDGYLDRLTHAPIKQTALAVELVGNKPLGESVGSLIAQALQSGPPVHNEPDRVATPVDNKQFMEQFKKEAGTLREKGQ